MTYEEGLRLAKEQGIPFMETSAKTGVYIEDIFLKLSEEILRKIENR